MKNKIFIIAEAGVNHNGDLVTAKKLVDVACESGADAVKFQTFKAELLVSAFAPKAPYQKRATDQNESQLNMIKKLELGMKAHKTLLSYCNKRGITFLSTPFDIESVDLLANLELFIFKVPSGEITNLPYLRKIGSLKKQVIMSSGMATLKEIGNALDVLLSAGTIKDAITILHCNSDYPTQPKDANLLAMLTIRDAFQVKIGYSDHTLGTEVSIASAALGATVIEKHFTLSRDMAGPDHKASLEPDELKAMVTAVRNIEMALGDGIKKPSKSESVNILAARKSIVALRDIRKGDIFSEKNITTKRPGTGLEPMKWDEVVGKAAKKNFKTDEFIEI